MSRARLVRAVGAWFALGLVLVIAAVLVTLAGTKPLERTLTDFFLVATMVVALQMFVGNSGIVSFGHMSFVGIGAYAAALVTIPPLIKEQTLTGLPGFLEQMQLGLVPSVAVATVLAALLAALVGGAIARMRELAMAMATLALLVLIHAVLANWDSVTRGGYGIFGLPGNTTVWAGLVGLLLATLVALLYRASQPGLRLMATREDPLPARAVGVNVAATRFGGWVLSAALMGAAGALFAQHILAFDPDQFFFALTFTTLAMLVIGGRASVTGAVAGAGLVTVVSEALRHVERGVRIGPLSLPELPGLVQLSVAVMIVLVLVFRPVGLFGRLELSDVLAPLLGRRRSGASEEPPPPPGEREGSSGGGQRSGRPERAAPGPAPGPAMGNGQAALRAEALVMDFAGLRALGGVSLTLHRGEILGLIGPNGSGKTTLLNVVSGVYLPTAGRVRLEDRDVTGWRAHRIARLGLSRTFQNIRLFGGLTVRENVMAAARPGTSDADADRVLERLDLLRHAEDVASTLPYGVQRRVEIARAVVRRPSVLLLDEPAAGMNEAESEQLLRTISEIQQELGCSVVVIDHDLRLILRLCDRVQVLNEGVTIADGPPDAVAGEPVVIEAYLGAGREAG